MSGASGRGSFKLKVPVREQKAQVVPEFRELDEAGLGGSQLGRGERSDLPAWKPAPISLPKHDGQLGERETEGESAADEQYSGE